MRLLLLLAAALTAAGSVAVDIFAALNSKSANELAATIDEYKKSTGLDIRGPGGQTPLMSSVLKGNDVAVRLLLEAGADVTISEKDGYTPLHGAGFQGRAKIAKLLISHGLDVNDFHRDGFLPFHRACWGTEGRHSDTVFVFLEAGIDPDIKTRDGRTCLQMTANKGTIKVLEEWKKANSDL